VQAALRLCCAWRAQAELNCVVQFINLGRRTDRRGACEALLARLGVLAAAERVAAVDGRAQAAEGTLVAACKGAVTRESLRTDSMTRGWVMGGAMTPGGAALCATTHRLLSRAPTQHLPASRMRLVLEDDVFLPSGGGGAGAVRGLLELLAGGAAGDGGAAARAVDWDVILLGTHPESEIGEEVAPLPAATGGALRKVGNFFGLFAYLVRNADSARKMDKCMFPCDNQLDSAMAMAGQDGRLKILHVGVPLLASPRSKPGDTDIQRMDVDSFVDHACALHAAAITPENKPAVVEAIRQQFLAKTWD